MDYQQTLEMNDEDEFDPGQELTALCSVRLNGLYIHLWARPVVEQDIMIRSPGTSLLPLLLPPKRLELPIPLPLPPPPPPSVHPSASLFCLLLILTFLLFKGGKRSVRIVQWSEWSYVTAAWSEWGLWSACSSTCFGTPGVRMRTHTCPTNPPTCQGETSEQEACEGEFPCEIS